jgi:hypothetical protein
MNDASNQLIVVTSIEDLQTDLQKRFTKTPILISSKLRWMYY